MPEPACVQLSHLSSLRICQLGFNHLYLLHPATSSAGRPHRAAGASVLPGSRPRLPGSWRRWRLPGPCDVDRHGRMEKDPKLPRICAFLTLWLQRKHRAKPCRLQLPVPGQLPSPVSTAASSLCLWLVRWAGALGGCSEQSGLLLFLWDSLFYGAVGRNFSRCKQSCSWVGHRGFSAGGLFWCAAKWAVRAGLLIPT